MAADGGDVQAMAGYPVRKFVRTRPATSGFTRSRDSLSGHATDSSDGPRRLPTVSRRQRLRLDNATTFGNDRTTIKRGRLECLCRFADDATVRCYKSE